MAFLKESERRLAALEQTLLALLLLVMVSLSFTQVVLRGFSLGLLWADTLLRHLVLWAGFLGAALAAADDKQFAMDAGLRLMSERVRAGVGLLLHSLSAAVCVLMVRASWTFFASEKAAASVLFSAGSLHVPAWWFQTILPAGFALLAVHYLIKALLSAGELRGGSA